MTTRSHPKPAHVRTTALFALAALWPGMGAADVGGLAETDRRVVVYRELERQFVVSDGKPAIRQPFCGAPRSVSAVDEGPEILTPDGKYRRLKPAVRCEQLDISTACESGMYPSMRSGEDGRWAWTKARIGYAEFLKALARRAEIPEDVLKADFDAMDARVIDNIERRLNRPIRLQVYESRFGMGVINDNEADKGRTRALERAFAGHWNAYVASLPAARQSKLPFLFGEVGGCGGGEMEYALRTNPPGGKIRFISDIDALLCEALKIDAWDYTKCNGWTAVQSKTIGLAGTYRYVVEWPDGKSERDKVTVDQQREKALCLPRACP